MSSKQFSDITITDYSEKAVVVRGDTRKYKEDLKKLGGKYNGRLADGPGWIFPKKIERELNSFIAGGVRLISEEEAQAGEDKSTEWEKKRSITVVKDDGIELKKMYFKIDELSKKLDRILSILLGTAEVVVDSDSEDEVIPTKRLLTKNK